MSSTRFSVSIVALACCVMVGCDNYPPEPPPPVNPASIRIDAADQPKPLHPKLDLTLKDLAKPEHGAFATKAESSTITTGASKVATAVSIKLEHHAHIDRITFTWPLSSDKDETVRQVVTDGISYFLTKDEVAKLTWPVVGEQQMFSHTAVTRTEGDGIVTLSLVGNM